MKLSHSLFSHHTERSASYLEWNGKCFIAEWNGLPRRNEMKTGAASSEKAFLWSTFCACELCSSSIKIYEAALRAMKRTFGAWSESLFRLHSPFLPAAKMVEQMRAIRSSELRSKLAVTCCFYAETVWFGSIASKTKNILQTAKNGKSDPLYGKKWQCFLTFLKNSDFWTTVFAANHYHSLPYITITAFNSQTTCN